MLVGVEIKREIVDGALSGLKRAALPLAAALGGMLVPAGIYAAINFGNAETIQGWGVPISFEPPGQHSEPLPDTSGRQRDRIPQSFSPKVALRIEMWIE